MSGKDYVKRTRKIITTGFIICALFLTGLMFFNSMWGQRIVKNITSNTKGLERTVQVYSYNGKLLKEYKGNMVVEDGDGGTISIIVGNEKHIFSNATVIITEEK